MRRALRLSAVQVALIVDIVLPAPTAAAPDPPASVRVQAPAHEQRALERLVAELRSEGFDVLVVADGEPAPCAPGAATEGRGPSARETPYAGIEIDRGAGGIDLVARICHQPQPGRAVVSAPAADSDRLALAAVEALNGLTATPSRTPRAPRAPDEPRRQHHGVPVALSVSAVLVLEPLEGGAFAGTSMAVSTDVHRRIALDLELFVPLTEDELEGVDRDLSLAAAWGRFGARTHIEWPWLKASASLHAGMVLLWVSAETRDPALIGVTELVKAGMLSGGLWLESPSDSLVYFRAGCQASRLLPSARVELGDGRTHQFGDLLVEVGLGLGVRWGLD